MQKCWANELNVILATYRSFSLAHCYGRGNVDESEKVRKNVTGFFDTLNKTRIKLKICNRSMGSLSDRSQILKSISRLHPRYFFLRMKKYLNQISSSKSPFKFGLTSTSDDWFYSSWSMMFFSTINLNSLKSGLM